MQTKFSADFFAVRIPDGTVFIGPAAEIDAATLSWPRDHRVFRGPLEVALRSSAELDRLREVFVRWANANLTIAFDDRQLCLEVAKLVENGRLAARFLPRFIRDPRGPDGGAQEPFRRYQLDGAQLVAKVGLASTPSESMPLIPRPRPPPEKAATDFPDEATQAGVLKKAARDGVPFCEVCAKAAAARANAA